MSWSFGGDLLERRVPQYLAVYLGASWAVVEFFAFLEDRFLLSPHLTNLVLLVLVLLLPSVMMFTWFHGRKGADDWTRTEKIFIPANLLAGGLILFAAFSGKELGAVTTTVLVEDEEGHTVERVVPHSEFRRRVAVFPLDVDTTDARQAWLGEGVADALTVDLLQDMFLDIRERNAFQQELEQAGYASGQGVPGALKRRLTQGLHLGYYVDGGAQRTDDEYRFTLALYDAPRGQMLVERFYQGPDLFALVDTASVQLRRDLDIPLRQIDESPDVPVAQILTGSVPAFRALTEATILSAEADLGGALEKLDRAVAADPGFALAHLTRYATLVRLGDAESARTAIQQAMEHSYRLPERLQYRVKGEWFGIQQEFAKMFAVYEMWAELYPQDILAQSAAAQVRLIQNDRPGAIEKYERILALDPARSDLLRTIGTLYEGMGELRRARDYYERYAEANPEDKESYISLAGLSRLLGDHEAARSLYERARLLAPDDVDLMLAVASLDRDTGRFEAALRGYQSAMDAARTPRERYAVLRGLARYHEYRGSYAVAVEYLEQAVAEGQKFQTPITQAQARLVSLDSYVLAGRPDRALAVLDSLLPQLPPPLDALVPIGQIQLFAALELPDQLATAVEAGQEMLDRLQYTALRQPVVWGQGRLHELRGEWAEALAAYQEERELSPTDPAIPARIGRCFRELEELDRAESRIRETLAARPSDGGAHLELARVYEAMGAPSDAVTHARRSLETWAPADAGFSPAAEARALVARLEAPQR